MDLLRWPAERRWGTRWSLEEACGGGARLERTCLTEYLEMSNLQNPQKRKTVVDLQFAGHLSKGRARARGYHLR